MIRTTTTARPYQQMCSIALFYGFYIQQGRGSQGQSLFLGSMINIPFCLWWEQRRSTNHKFNVGAATCVLAFFGANLSNLSYTSCTTCQKKWLCLLSKNAAPFRWSFSTSEIEFPARQPSTKCQLWNPSRDFLSLAKSFHLFTHRAALLLVGFFSLPFLPLGNKLEN